MLEQGRVRDGRPDSWRARSCRYLRGFAHPASVASVINEPAGAEGGSIEPTVAAALEGNLGDEPLVAAQWARPLGSTEKGHAGLGRFFKRLTGSGDGLTDMMILAATPTRLILFSAHTGWSGLTVRGVTGEWPLAEAELTSR